MDMSSAATGWHIRNRELSLARPLVMGVINVTPDSFSDGGRYAAFDAALKHARQLITDGADIVDIGGESTRPGAAEVSAEDEIARVVPLIEALRDDGVALSVDTSKPQVMRAALAAGASIINDVRALQLPGAVDAVAAAECGVVLMHMQGTPRTMQQAPRYDNVVAEVADFLSGRLADIRAAGVDLRRVAVDPGFGFGKTVAHNFTLLRDLAQLGRLGQPVLVGLSRKSMLGAATGRNVTEREFASVAALVLAIERGARIVRVHEVASARDAIAIWQAMTNGGQAA